MAGDPDEAGVEDRQVLDGSGLEGSEVDRLRMPCERADP